MITPPQQYAWRGFDQLSTTELYLLLRLRCEVFVVEQRCAYLDIDGRDQEADHLLAWGANDRLSGYLRVFAPGKVDASAQIGRIVTSSEGRGAGLGRWMVKEALGFIAKRHGGGADVVGQAPGSAGCAPPAATQPAPAAAEWNELARPSSPPPAPRSPTGHPATSRSAPA